MLDPATIKKHALERVKEITESLEALVDSFELDLQKHLKQAYKSHGKENKKNITATFNA